MKKTKVTLILTMILTMIIYVPEINAATLPVSKNCYYFNASTGAFSNSKLSSSYQQDCVKELTGETDVNGKPAYCVEWGKSIKTLSYQKDTSWKEKSKNAILAGIMIGNINKDNSGNKAYGIAAASLNTFFSKKYTTTYPASKNFYNSNATIKKYYDGAAKEYTDKGYTTGVTIPTPSITAGTSILDYNSTGKYYISKSITAKLTKEYGGDPVIYTISTNNKQATICTSSSGRNCTTTKEVRDVATTTFYVKVPEGAVTAGATIRINIIGKNSSTYPSILQYKGTNYVNTTQKLVIPTTVTISRTTEYNYNLTVPNLNQHMIKIIKVDEYGNELSGAKLELREGTTTLKSNNGSAEFYHLFEKTTIENDNFFEKSYSLIELHSPNGYVLNNKPIPIPIEELKKGTTETCYKTDGEEYEKADNPSRCNFDNYDYVCLNSKQEITDKVTVENNCEVLEAPTPEIPTPTPGEGEEGGEPTTQEETGTTEDDSNQEGDGGTTEPEEPEEPVETYTKVCYSKSESKAVDASYCTDKDKYTIIQTNNGNITMIQPNALNKVYISKKDMTGVNEVSGAELKICTKETYEKDKLDCETAKTVKNVEMHWISTSNPKWIQGVPTGKYVIIEVLPPNGYTKVTTVTEFEVDDTGKVTSHGNTEEDPIIIKNQTNKISISKQDITTSKELPGATLSICLTYYNEETKKTELEIDEVTGDCIPAMILATKGDGKKERVKATWTSTDKPHEIEGLPAGTYYLVENIAPKNYSTAESILFTMHHDGTITDANNNPITENKIVMKDALLEQVKTGDLPLIAIITIGLVGLATGVICYHYTNKKYNII